MESNNSVISADESNKNFVMKNRATLEYVITGQLKVEEFGLWTALELLINPRQGYWLGNISLLAGLLNLSQSRTRYILDKLKDMEKIYFYLRQGQREKAKFYVIGQQLQYKSVEKTRIVMHPELIVRMELCLSRLDTMPNFSEVESIFPKWLLMQCPTYSIACKHDGKANSEVPYTYTEKETEIKRKKDIKSERVRAPENSPPEQPIVTQEIFDALVKSMGIDGTKKYLKDHNYKLPHTVD